jgi:hypothetical protein
MKLIYADFGMTTYCIQVNQPTKWKVGLPAMGHHIQFHDTSILAKKSGHMEHFIKEVIETELHPDNMNRDKGL